MLHKPRYEYRRDDTPDLAPPHCIWDNLEKRFYGGAFASQADATSRSHILNDANHRAVERMLRSASDYQLIQELERRLSNKGT